MSLINDHQFQFNGKLNYQIVTCFNNFIFKIHRKLGVNTVFKKLNE